MQLYFHPASTTCRIIMMFVAEEGMALDYALVDLMKGEQLTPEFKGLNPNGLVPVLDDEGFRLTESGAIIRYLADKVGSAAYPKDLEARARVEEAMQWFYSNYYKDHGYGLVYPQVFPQHKRPSEEIQAGTIAWGKQKAQIWLAILDQNMIGATRRFVCGDSITLADYVGAELVALGELVHCRYADYPNVRRWIGNMRALKHWTEVHQVADSFTAALKDKQFVSI
jgi:glutathione S-transferase